jgi:phage replication O-like protein O
MPERVGIVLRPNTTQTPDAILVNMQDFSDTELRIVLAVVRSTLGWKKKEDWLTRSEIERRTGRGHTSVCNAISSLVERGYIVVRDEEGNALETPNARKLVGERHAKLFFALNVDEPVQKVDRACPKSGQGPVQKVDTTTPTHYNTQSLQQPPLSARADAPAKPAIFCEGSNYSEAFERLWGNWLALNRGIDKRGAARQWNATLRSRMNGTKPEEAAERIVTAAGKFAEAMRAEGRTPELVMHAARFLGRDQCWTDYENWAPAIGTGRARDDGLSLQKATVDAGDVQAFERALAGRKKSGVTAPGGGSV